jgi:predicted NAD/FAD-binding protein
LGEESHNIDSGFIVFNEKTYPNFLQLLSELKVDYQPSSMGFSVQCEATGLEYSGTNLNTLFAQRRNLFKPSFYRMIKDILRFNQSCLELLYSQDNGLSLGDYLTNNNYSQQFIDNYILPMGAAIWSTDQKSMFNFPARFFVQFFNNHGLLNVNDRPQWYVIKGGSKQYIEPLIKDHKNNIHLSSPVEKIIRQDNQVIIKAKGHADKIFDYVFIASHSDQALKMLDEPTALEQKTLSAINYIPNLAMLHTDEKVLPKRKLAWAAWNYHLLNKETSRVSLSYSMNILQSLKSQHNFIVSLNHSDAINKQKVIKEMNYSHPLFTLKGIAAQDNHSKINGTKRTFYSGAYWRYGFHEDGVVSAIQALKDFNEKA